MIPSAEIRGTELLGFPVPISEIEQELTRLFAKGERGNESGLTRASLLNLVLYSERPGELAQNAETIAEITRETVCRSILVCVDPVQDQVPAKCWIQAHCQLDREGKKSVCSEQISFVLGGSSPGLVRNTVFSHLDSDLPLAFWWRGEFSDAFEERLYSRIDRLIFDSENWENPRNQLVRLADAVRSGNGNFCFHDLSFTRLNQYRQAISNAFDLPGFLRSVHLIEGMKICYPEGSRMSAIYLGAWLASRLGGELDRGYSHSGKFVFRTKSAQSPAEFAVETIAVTEEDFAVSLKVDKQIVEWSRCPARDYLRTRILDESGNGEGAEEWLPIQRKNDASLITEILERGGRNRSLPNLINLAGEMLTVA